MSIKLWDIPSNSKINIEVSDGSKYVIFRHLDGMYSYCDTEKGGYINLRGDLELEKDGKDYKISKMIR